MTRKVNASAAATDILAGISEEELKEKYSLSHEELASIRNSAEATDLLKRRAEAQPLSVAEKDEPETWTCPSCGKSIPRSLRECPECTARAKEPPPQPKEPEAPAPVRWHKVNQWIRKPIVAASVGALALALVMATAFAVSSVFHPFGQENREQGANTFSAQANALPRNIETAVLAHYIANLPKSQMELTEGRDIWRLYDLQIVGRPIPGTSTEGMRRHLKPKDIYCLCLRVTWLRRQPKISGSISSGGYRQIPLYDGERSKNYLVTAVVDQDGLIVVSPASLVADDSASRMEDVCGGSPCESSQK